MWEREKGRRRRRRKKTSGRGIPASCLWSQRLQSPPTPPPAGPARHLHRQSTDLFPSWWQLTITSSLSLPPPFEFAFASLSPYPFTISYQVSTALLCSAPPLSRVTLKEETEREQCTDRVDQYGRRRWWRWRRQWRHSSVSTWKIRFARQSEIREPNPFWNANPIHSLTHSLYSIIMPSFSLRLWTFLYSRFYF